MALLPVQSTSNSITATWQRPVCDGQLVNAHILSYDVILVQDSSTYMMFFKYKELFLWNVMFVFVLSSQRNCVERTSTVGRRHTRSKTCDPTPPTRFNFAPTSAMETERHKRTPPPSKVPQTTPTSQCSRIFIVFCTHVFILDSRWRRSSQWVSFDWCSCCRWIGCIGCHCCCWCFVSALKFQKQLNFQAFL